MSVIKNKASKQTGIRNNKMMEAAVLDVLREDLPEEVAWCRDLHEMTEWVIMATIITYEGPKKKRNER